MIINSGERMSNKTAVVVAKDIDVFLLLIYALEQLKCFLPPWCMVIGSNQFVKIKMIDDSVVSEISDVVQELHVTTSWDTAS